MKYGIGRFVVALFALTGASCAGLAAAAQYRATLVIAGGTLISGSGTPAIEDTVVYIRDGRIERIEVVSDGRFPEGPNVLAAHGKFLVPGLVEAHAHIDHVTGIGLTQEQRLIAREYNPRAFLYHGVTTVINMSSRDLGWVQQVQRDAARSAILPRILTGGEHFTTNGGWGGRHGGGVASVAQIHERVDQAAASGVDLIKIIYEDGLGQQPAFERLPAELMKEIALRSKQRQLPVFIHATDHREYADALAAGPTALAHGLLTPLERDDPILEQLRQRGTYVVPTIVLFEAFARFVDSPELLQDPLLQASVPDFALQSVSDKVQLQGALDQMNAILKMNAVEWARRSLGVLKENTRQFAVAGVPLAVGADSGGAVPHAFQGYNTIREMEILAECCLTPMQTIVAATRNGASMMGREREFGTLSPGMSADLLILNANPLLDMRNIRDFDTLVLRGRPVQRSSLTFASFMRERGSKK